MIFLSLQYQSVFAETVNVRMVPDSSVPGCEKLGVGQCYFPSRPTVKVGDKVIWKNYDSAGHTVTSGTSSGGPDGLFDSGIKMANQSYGVQFNKEGSFPYFCMVHPWMTGKITVEKKGIEFNSIKLYDVSPSTIFEGETATISGQIISTGQIPSDTIVVSYKTNTGLSGSVWNDDDGHITMNVLWPVGTHTITTSLKGDFGTLVSNSVVLVIKPREPPKTIITLEPMRDYGTSTDGLAEFTGRVTTQDGQPLSGKNVSVKFEKQGKTGVTTEFDITDSSGRYSVVYGFNGNEGDWKVYAVFEDGVQYKAAESNKLVFSVLPDPVPTQTPEPIKTTPTTPQVTSSPVTINVQMTKSYYNKGDTITAYGTVSKNTGDKVGILVTAPNGNLILVDLIKVDSSNNFATQIQTGSESWDTSGTYNIKANYGDSSDNEYFQYQANKLAPVASSSTSEAPTTSTATSAPTGTDVILALGSSVPGCEESCYLPYSLNIKTNDVIDWYNADSAAHTVTSGNPTSGPNGKFDSNLFLAGSTFSHKFTQSGNYPYFCMVHPWMTGEIIVSGNTQSSTNTFKSYADTGSSIPNDPSKEYTIQVQGTKHSITYKISSGQITNSKIDEGTTSIILNLINVKDGQLSIKIPRELLDAKIGTRDDNFFVLVNGKEIDYSESKNTRERILIIPFGTGTEEIEIIGSKISGGITSSQTSTPSSPIIDNTKNSQPQSKIKSKIDWLKKPDIQYRSLVTFEGKLIDENSNPISRGIITIYEEFKEKSPSKLLETTTDSLGNFEFSITEKDHNMIGEKRTFYATYLGDSKYSPDNSPYLMSKVAKIPTSISLEASPLSASVTEIVRFNGKLELPFSKSPEGAIIYIKDYDMDPLNPDETLAITTVNADGTFSVMWQAEMLDDEEQPAFEHAADLISKLPYGEYIKMGALAIQEIAEEVVGYPADVYAVYDGDKYYAESISCNNLIPIDKVVTCKNTIQVAVTDPLIGGAATAIDVAMDSFPDMPEGDKRVIQDGLIGLEGNVRNIPVGLVENYKKNADNSYSFANYEILILEKVVKHADTTLAGVAYQSTNAQTSLENAHNSISQTNRILDKASSLLEEGKSLYKQSKYREADVKFNSAYTTARGAEKTVLDISEHANKAYIIQFGNNLLYS